jgi:hypothetical protein
MSSTPRLAFFKSPSIAGTGPHPIVVGSTPAANEGEDEEKKRRWRVLFSVVVLASDDYIRHTPLLIL